MICRFVRMAYLALVASHTVNGVAALHTSILKDSIFRDFVDLWPHKFQNKTNGVTPRRWLAFCNPALADLITRTLGSDAWVNNLSLLTVSPIALTAMASLHFPQSGWWAVTLPVLYTCGRRSPPQRQL